MKCELTNSNQRIPKILGVDFDDTLFHHSWPNNFDKPNWNVIDYVKSKQKAGWYIILVSCRTKPEHINGAIIAAESVGIHFDAINENHPEMIRKFGDCRKIYCDEYIDDKNVSIASINADTIISSHCSNHTALALPSTLLHMDGVIDGGTIMGGELFMPSAMKRERKRLTVYISGKMRGLENYGREKFKAAEEYLKSLGVIVINPSNLPDDIPTEKYMPICIPLLEASDCIYMLDNWQDSVGAQAEYSYAKCQNKLILYENGPDGGNQQWS